MDDTQMQIRRQKIEAVAKGVVAFVGCVVVAPIVFLAIKGLVGLIVAGVIGLGVINLAPVIAFKLGNWRLAAIKAEAAKNPIETLEQDYAERQQALSNFKHAITTFSAAVQTFKDKLEGFSIKFPKDTDKFNDQFSKMKKLLDVRKHRYKEAEAALDQYSSEIDRAKAIWAMGQEAAKMNAAAGMTDEDFLAKLKQETAMDSVTTSMNTAFAELETSLMEEDGTQEAQKLIEQQPTTAFRPIEMPKKQEVKRG